MDSMNHCINCGRQVSRGSTAPHPTAVRCLVCQVKDALRTFRYQSRAAQLRALGKQKEAEQDES
jgi:hypothetical protein